MKIAVLKERREHETRVAATPDTVKRFLKLGASVTVEKDAGLAASIPDDQFVEAGATIAADAKATASGADVILKVRRPLAKGEGGDESAVFAKGQTLVSTLDALWQQDKLEPLAKKGVN
ncbi:MAG: NAD(P)(+) transhydrogenase (Re/Si-specific) subunit alpha, partial [Pseudomonadota bacterium]